MGSDFYEFILILQYMVLLITTFDLLCVFMDYLEMLISKYPELTNTIYIIIAVMIVILFIFNHII